MAANLSSLLKWAHQRAKRVMSDGARLAVGGGGVTYQQAFSDSIRSAWRSEDLRRSFGLVTASAAKFAKAEAARKAAYLAAGEARDVQIRVNCETWAAELSDGQLLSAIYDAECDDSPIYSRLLDNWQARADNRIRLAALRAEQAGRNQKEAA
jgi:hypothetical protein